MSWAKKCEKSYAGLWVPFIITGAAVAGLQLITRSLDDSAGNPPAVRQEAAPKEIPLTEETAANFSDGLEFKLYYTPQKEWAGAKIRLDRAIMQDWAKYAPVKITIPELNYTAPFPVEDAANSAETKFPSPAASSGTYHYIIFGWNPRKGTAKELYNYVIFPKKQND
jgi:hypothetical protein